MVEMYSRGAFREDLLEERCAQVAGIDTRLEEIDELLHGREGAARCTCGAPVLHAAPLLPELRPPARRGARRLGRAMIEPLRRQRRLIGWTGRTPGLRVAAHRACPRCRARRAEREYCVECGLLLPVVVGPIAALRSRWLRRFGWYPGDWVWLSLPALAVAVFGGCDLDRHQPPHGLCRSVNARRAESTGHQAGVGLARPNGRTFWPGKSQRLDGCPRPSRQPRARSHPAALARRAARAGLPEDAESSTPSRLLEPPSGLLRRLQRHLQCSRRRRNGPQAVHASGFGSAYSRQIAR